MKYIVIKCGGSVLEQLPKSFYEDVVELHRSGEWIPILVHGGGPLITKLLTELKIETTFVNGLRVTDQQVLDIVEMVLSGSVNKQVVRKLIEAGGSAIGVSGVDGSLLKAVPGSQAEQLGYVGEVMEVNQKIINSIVDLGFIPVISPVGVDDKGQHYNINGDIAASAIAKSIGANLCLVSDIPGILIDCDGEKKKLDVVTKAEVEEMIRNQTIYGGMIPKVTAAIDGLVHKIPEVGIINGFIQKSLIDYTKGKAVGTKIIL